MLNDDLDVALHNELSSGERILWSGSPRQGIMLRTWDILLIPFSLLWGGFAIFWEVLAITIGAPLLFALWGGFFVLAGLFFIFGRFFVDAGLRSRTLYALTNERVITLSGVFSRSVTSLSLRTLPTVSLDVKSDGRGTITFGAGRSYPNIGFGTGRYAPPAFDAIVDARTVYRLVLQAQKDSA